jgi:hypothetical protein
MGTEMAHKSRQALEKAVFKANTALPRCVAKKDAVLTKILSMSNV